MRSRISDPANHSPTLLLSLLVLLLVAPVHHHNGIFPSASAAVVTCAQSPVDNACDPSPRDVAFLVDTSNTMGAKTFFSTAVDFVEQMYCSFQTGSRAGVILFGDTIRTAIPLANYSKAEFLARMEVIRNDPKSCCSPGSPYAEAFDMATNMFKTPSINSIKVAMVLGDGITYQIDTGIYGYPHIASEARYRFQIVPQTAQFLKAEGVRLMLIGLPTYQLKPAAVMYFQGVWNPEWAPPPSVIAAKKKKKRKAAKAKKKKKAKKQAATSPPTNLQCAVTPRSGASDCYPMNSPPFPIVSLPVVNNTVVVANVDSISDALSEAVGQLCVTTSTSSPTTSPTNVGATSSPTFAPTKAPSSSPTSTPSKSPTLVPTKMPSASPTISPTKAPSASPTNVGVSSSPTFAPTKAPSSSPTSTPSNSPTLMPTKMPSASPTISPTKAPSASPTLAPTDAPTMSPTRFPTASPTAVPSAGPSTSPSLAPTYQPTSSPTRAPTKSPTNAPTKAPSASPTLVPTKSPTQAPTKSPTQAPTKSPTQAPTKSPTQAPTKSPTQPPTTSPTLAPTTSPTLAPTKSPTRSPTASPTQAPTFGCGDGKICLFSNLTGSNGAFAGNNWCNTLAPTFYSSFNIATLCGGGIYPLVAGLNSGETIYSLINRVYAPSPVPTKYLTTLPVASKFGQLQNSWNTMFSVQTVLPDLNNSFVDAGVFAPATTVPPSAKWWSGSATTGAVSTTGTSTVLDATCFAPTANPTGPGWITTGGGQKGQAGDPQGTATTGPTSWITKGSADVCTATNYLVCVCFPPTAYGV